MESQNNIYDGCEFDENKNIDWDALDITEELALQISGPVPACGVDQSMSKKHPRLEDEGENENIKFMRFGSLGRIIASSVAASTPPVSFYFSASIAPRADNLQARKEIAEKFISAFNFGDMGRLAVLVRELCDETCLLITPDVDYRDCIVGKADVMMLFSLLFETFPDGVYRTLSSSVEDDRATIIYSFTGTRVFEQSINCLYKQCRKHVAEGSIVANPQNYGCELDLIQISKTTTQNSVAVEAQLKQYFPSSSERRTSLPPGQSTGHLQQQHHYNPFQSLQHKFSETVIHLMPHAGRLASEALKEGPGRIKRSMEMNFDDNNHIVKIVFCNIVRDVTK